MATKRFLTFFLLILSFTLAILPSPFHAQNTPRDYLALHNAARAKVNVGPLKWDAAVEEYAKDYVKKRMVDCELPHSKGPYGENLARGSRDLSVADAVNLWVNEKKYYHYDTNTCEAGKVCGHYTQVVWENSTKLGCARVKCYNGKGIFITCNYHPPGNYAGQKPYKPPHAV